MHIHTSTACSSWYIFVTPIMGLVIPKSMSTCRRSNHICCCEPHVHNEAWDSYSARRKTWTQFMHSIWLWIYAQHMIMYDRKWRSIPECEFERKRRHKHMNCAEKEDFKDDEFKYLHPDDQSWLKLGNSGSKGMDDSNIGWKGCAKTLAQGMRQYHSNILRTHPNIILAGALGKNSRNDAVPPSPLPKCKALWRAQARPKSNRNCWASV